MTFILHVIKCEKLDFEKVGYLAEKCFIEKHQNFIFLDMSTMKKGNLTTSKLTSNLKKDT